MAIDTKQTDPGLIELVRSAAADTTELVKQQIELTKAEVKENVPARPAPRSACWPSAASILGMGGIFLLVTLAYVLVQLGLPVWAGFGIVTLFLFIVGAILVLVGTQPGEVGAAARSASMAALEATKSTLRG